MDTGSLLYEIENIEKELVRLRTSVKELNSRKKDLERQIIEIMQDTDEQSITHNGKTYTLEETQHRGRKADKKKREDALAILAAEGYHGEEAEEMYNKLTSALRGPENITFKLKK